ncbi:MAG: tRNA-dihydrouridine synthase [Desulfomonilaceae bacterium]
MNISSLFQPLQDSNLAHFKIKSPFTIPSGIVTTVPSVIARIARDVPQIGFLTTKTLSLSPRSGYREPVLHEYYPGCFVNAVGLANPGAESFLETMRSLLPLQDSKPLFVSIMGADPEEFLECARILDPIADAFELNLSCPHVKGAGQYVGSDPHSVRSIIRLLKKHLNKPIIPKLSPNLGDIGGMSKLCEAAGADALSLINTVGPGIAVDSQGQPILSNVIGGLSGAGILPVGLKAVREAASLIKIPIIASGGICSARDVIAYKSAGATFFAVGSALAGMTTSLITGFFEDLIDELEQGQSDQSARGLPIQPLTDYFRTTVVDNRTIGAGIFMLRLKEGPSCPPGRFFFLRLPGVGEKPFSPMFDMEPVYLVRNVGPFTAALERLKPGDPVDMRGPYGKGFPPPEEGRPLILIGGGTGAAPIILAGTFFRKSVSKAFFGFSAEIAKSFEEQIVTRIPGSQIVSDPPGKIGEIVRALESDLVANPALYRDCAAFVCGPRPMMRAVIDALRQYSPKGGIHLAREDVMRCGIGICGSCGTENGWRSCVDGPVMRHD